MSRGTYKPTAIERGIFGILAAVVGLAGLYLVGPWYLQDTLLGDKAPIINLMKGPTGVTIYGAILLIDAIALIYATAGRGVHYTAITSYALLAGFLLRLYSLIGVFLTLESWRPPGYLTQVAIVAILGAMYVWVRVSERVTK